MSSEVETSPRLQADEIDGFCCFPTPCAYHTASRLPLSDGDYASIIAVWNTPAALLFPPTNSSAGAPWTTVWLWGKYPHSALPLTARIARIFTPHHPTKSIGLCGAKGEVERGDFFRWRAVAVLSYSRRRQRKSAETLIEYPHTEKRRQTRYPFLVLSFRHAKLLVIRAVTSFR